MYHQLSNEEWKERGEMHLHPVRCNSNFRNLRESWTDQMRVKEQELKEVNEANLFVKNLSQSVTKLLLFKTFSSFGEIISCNIATDLEGLCKGYGMVHFYSIESAKRAVKNLHGSLLNGKKILVGPLIRKKDGKMAIQMSNTKEKNSDMGHNQSLEEKFDRWSKLMEMILCNVSEEEVRDDKLDEVEGSDNCCMSAVEGGKSQEMHYEYVHVHHKSEVVQVIEDGSASRIKEKEKNENDPISLEDEVNEVKHGEEGTVDECCVVEREKNYEERDVIVKVQELHSNPMLGYPLFQSEHHGSEIVPIVEGKKDPEREVAVSISEMHHEPVFGCTSIMGEGEGSKQDEIWKELDVLNEAQTETQLVSQLFQPEPIAATTLVQLAPQAMYLDPQPMHLEQEFMQHELLLELEKSKAFSRKLTFQNCPFHVKEQVIVEKNSQFESLDTGQTNPKRDDVVSWSMRMIISQKEGINNQLEVKEDYRSRVKHGRHNEKRMKPSIEPIRKGYISKWLKIKLPYFDPGGRQSNIERVLQLHIKLHDENCNAGCVISVGESKGLEMNQALKNSDMLYETHTKVQLASQLIQHAYQSMPLMSLHVQLVAEFVWRVAEQAMHLELELVQPDFQPSPTSILLMPPKFQHVFGKHMIFSRKPMSQNCPLPKKWQLRDMDDIQTERGGRYHQNPKFQNHPCHEKEQPRDEKMGSDKESKGSMLIVAQLFSANSEEVQQDSWFETQIALLQLHHKFQQFEAYCALQQPVASHALQLALEKLKVGFEILIAWLHLRIIILISGIAISLILRHMPRVWGNEKIKFLCADNKTGLDYKIAKKRVKNLVVDTWPMRKGQNSPKVLIEEETIDLADSCSRLTQQRAHDIKVKHGVDWMRESKEKFKKSQLNKAKNASHKGQFRHKKLSCVDSSAQRREELYIAYIEGYLSVLLTNQKGKEVNLLVKKKVVELKIMNSELKLERRKNKESELLVAYLFNSVKDEGKKDGILVVVAKRNTVQPEMETKIQIEMLTEDATMAIHFTVPHAIHRAVQLGNAWLDNFRNQGHNGKREKKNKEGQDIKFLVRKEIVKRKIKGSMERVIDVLIVHLFNTIENAVVGIRKAVKKVQFKMHITIQHKVHHVLEFMTVHPLPASFSLHPALEHASGRSWRVKLTKEVHFLAPMHFIPVTTPFTITSMAIQLESEVHEILSELYVSQLKMRLGERTKVVKQLSVVDPDRQELMAIEPKKSLLVLWYNRPEEELTWVDYDVIEDKNFLKQGELSWKYLESEEKGQDTKLGTVETFDSIHHARRRGKNDEGEAVLVGVKQERLTGGAKEFKINGVNGVCSLKLNEGTKNNELFVRSWDHSVKINQANPRLYG